MHNRALGYIQYLQNIWRETTHPDSNTDEATEARIGAAYTSLQQTLGALLGVPLERDPKQGATLFGFPVGAAQLSDGQKVLLQLAVAVHAQKAQLGELILFWDEPELHLHPESLTEVVSTVRKNNPRGQVWIATHSVHALAAVDPREVWYVDGGRVEWAGRTPERVLEGLLGGDTDASSSRSSSPYPRS